MFYRNNFKSQRNCPNGTQPYTIMAGDTLYGIAMKFGTTVLNLIFLNPFLQPYNLVVGQVICVPGTTCPDGTFYTIQPGDTLYTIATKHGVTVDAIINANPSLDPYNLMPGRMICMPPKPSRVCPDDSNLYEVKPDDTLIKILVKYDYSYAALKYYNPDTDLKNLSSGMQLCIPKDDTFSIGYCPTGNSYVIKRNDTLSSIAEKHVVGADDLMMYNPAFKPSDFEKPNMTICIPPEAEV